MLENRKLQIKVLNLMYDGYYRCPNNGTIFPKLKGDDKAICTCNKTNPKIPSEYPGIHVVAYLEAVTAEDFLDFEATRMVRFEEKFGKADDVDR